MYTLALVCDRGPNLAFISTSGRRGSHPRARARGYRDSGRARPTLGKEPGISSSSRSAGARACIRGASGIWKARDEGCLSLSSPRPSTLLALAWVSRQVTPGGRVRRRGWKGWRDIRYSEGMDRGMRGEGWPSGATLTWHVGRYQVLPRHRVDAERRRMCDRFPSSSLSFLHRPLPLSSLRFFLPLLPCSLRASSSLFLSLFLALSHSFLSSYARAAHTTLVSLHFCTRGDTPL